MIIRTNVNLPKTSPTPNVEETKVDEEVIVKPVVKERKRKSTPPVVVEEKIEDEDLSKWLEEHTDD